MSNINIKSFSLDKKEFYNVNGTIDLIKRNICFSISSEEIKRILGVEIEELLFGADSVMKKLENIYLYDENNVVYYCIGCIFSIKAKDIVEFSSVAINIMLENTVTDINEIKTNKVTFKTNYMGRSIHDAYIRSYSFSYDSTKKIIVNTHTDDNYNIDITVESSKKYSYYKLSKILYTYVEMLFLLFGDMPTITEVSLLEDDKAVKLYFDIVEKYNPKYKKRHGKEILGTITNKSINRENMKKFEQFRKGTKIIYDLLMININSEGYVEIKNCNLVQIMEGMYRTITGSSDELRVILNHYFSDYNNSKKVLSRRDKRIVNDSHNTPIFIYKAKNHRNYLSHLNINENKNVFYKIENNYAYWKLCIAIRIYILEYIDIEYEKDYVPRYIEEIEDWAKKNKLRFSLKANT